LNEILNFKCAHTFCSNRLYFHNLYLLFKLFISQLHGLDRVITLFLLSDAGFLMITDDLLIKAFS